MQLFTPAGIALSNGASSSTTNADLPPSSRHTFLMPSPATDAMRRPACSDPVKLTMSTSGCATIASPTTRPEPETMLSTPVGQADLVRGLGEHERAERRHLRRLQHHRAAGRQRRRDLADHLVQRVVPRRHAADDADRFLDDQRVAELFFELRFADELGVHPDHHDRELGLHLGGDSRARCRLRARSPRRSAARASSSRPTSFSSHCARSSTGTRLHASNAARAAFTARSTSSAVPRGTRATSCFGGGRDDGDRLACRSTACQAPS